MTRRTTYRGMLLGGHVDSRPCDNDAPNGKPLPTTVIGLGFGDEGKGMAVAHEAARARAMGLDPMVVRFNGGLQAAHNVRITYTDGTVLHHTHSQMGSGTMLGASTILTDGMLMSPVPLAREADALARLMDDPTILSKVTVDMRCPVAMPLHSQANQMLETARGDARHGSTGWGIGIARACEAAVRDGSAPADMMIDVESLLPSPSGVDRLTRKMSFWHEWIGRRFGISLDIDEDGLRSEALHMVRCTKELIEYGMHVVDGTADMVREAMDDGWTHVIFEGSQGILLDERHGWFPHVTYGDMTSDRARQIADGRPLHILGITRCYQTRHGAGPMPTEGTFDIAEPDNGTGTWTGAFRTGLLDIPTLSRASGAVKPDAVAVSCLDMYPGRYVKWWNGYEDGELDMPVPTNPSVIEANEGRLLSAIEDACSAGIEVMGRGNTIDMWSDTTPRIATKPRP